MRRIPSLILAFTLLAACGKKDAPAPTPTPPTETATAAPATLEPPPETVAATTEDTVEPAPEADTAAPAPTAQAGEDWLVWSRVGGGWLTRWVSVTHAGFELVAEKKAVIVSDGARLFRVERADVTVDVSPCVCLDEEDAPDCKVIGKVTRPGLRAVDLAGGAPIDVYKAEDGPMWGSDMDLAVDLGGGVGALLFVDWNDGGYFCGAHGSWEGGTKPFDVAKRAVPDAIYPTVDRKLPEAVHKPALDELYAPLKDCEDEEMTREQAAERVGLGAVGVRIGEGGAPSVTWTFSADVMYACSADYGVHATVTTGLLPEASDLGLAGPLPGGVVKALAAAPEQGTVGWARVTLEGDARAAALAAFQASPEPAWGPTRFSEVLNEASAPTGDAAAAKKAVSEGRKLTRAKDYAGAVAKFGEAIALDATHAPAYSGRGYAQLLGGMFDGAKADFDKALELDKEPVYQAQVYFNLGQVAEKQNDPAAAKAAYAKSLELRPNDAVQKALDRLK